MMLKNVAVAVEKAKKIKLVVFDVHGVLSNNDVLYDSQGTESGNSAMRTVWHECHDVNGN